MTAILYFSQEYLKHLLQHVNHDIFKTTILPAIDRAMLRNPEIMLAGMLKLEVVFSRLMSCIILVH